MEVSRKRLLQKHLEPARPLRRCTHVDVKTMNKCTDELLKHEPVTSYYPEAPPCEKPIMDYRVEYPGLVAFKKMILGKKSKNSSPITLEQFFKIINLNKPKERICYTRDFLISLASCAESKKKPDSLPEHPVVLAEARDELDGEVMFNRSDSRVSPEGVENER